MYREGEREDREAPAGGAGEAEAAPLPAAG